MSFPWYPGTPTRENPNLIAGWWLGVPPMYGTPPIVVGLFRSRSWTFEWISKLAFLPGNGCSSAPLRIQLEIWPEMVKRGKSWTNQVVHWSNWRTFGWDYLALTFCERKHAGDPRFARSFGDIWKFPEIGIPPAIIHFNAIYYKPSIFVLSPWLWKAPYLEGSTDPTRKPSSGGAGLGHPRIRRGWRSLDGGSHRWGGDDVRGKEVWPEMGMAGCGKVGLFWSQTMWKCISILL